MMIDIAPDGSGRLFRWCSQPQVKRIMMSEEGGLPRSAVTAFGFTEERWPGQLLRYKQRTTGKDPWEGTLGSAGGQRLYPAFRPTTLSQV